jgi:hypothetical protein
MDRQTLALAGWALVWLLVFCLPSQRSARYVIPAMPALAVLVALHWHRLHRGWFVASALLCLPVLLLLGRIAQTLHDQGLASPAQSALALTALLAGLCAVGAGLVRPGWSRASALVSTAAVYALLNCTLAPLSGPAGQFNVGPAGQFNVGPAGPVSVGLAGPVSVGSSEGPSAARPNPLPAQARVAVPSTFNAQHERYQFLLPAAVSLRLHAYTPEAIPEAHTAKAADARRAGSGQLADLLRGHDAVIWQQRGDEDQPPCTLSLPAGSPGAAKPGAPASCRIAAQRWDIRTRHQPGEIRLDNLAYPAQWLLRREWLLVGAGEP